MKAEFTLKCSESIEIGKYLDSASNIETATDVYIVFLKDESTLDTNAAISHQCIVPKDNWYRLKADCRFAIPGRLEYNHVEWHDEAINWPAIKNWLRGCSKGHNSCIHLVDSTNIKLGEKEPAIKDTRLKYAARIQCVNINTLKRTSRRLSSRYVALSYVWGGALERDDWPTFFHSDGKINFGKLPLTLQDAIRATKRLGEDYLWIDALSIDQRDEKDFKTQLSQMHLIYENAIFTIVALHGHSAKSGLPGVSVAQRNSKFKVLVNGRHIIAGPHIDFAQQVRNSAWQKRGWTFQEELSSRRKLYFAENEVLMRCQMSCVRESIAWRSVENPDHPFVGEKWELEEPYISLAQGRNDIRFLKDFHKLVENYTSRLLTFDSDIQDAFQGIQNHLSFKRGSEFVYGIPVAELAPCLLWGPKFNAFPLHRRGMFPSWSWLEWSGTGLRYPLQVEKSDDLWQQIRRFDFLAWPNDNNQTYAGEAFSVHDMPLAKLDPGDASRRTIQLESELRSFVIRRLEIGSPIEMDNNFAVQHPVNGQFLDTSEDIPVQNRADVFYPSTCRWSGVEMEQEAEFALMGRLKGLPLKRGPNTPPFIVDRVVALLISRRKNNTAERLAIVDIPEDFWDLAPIIHKCVEIRLV
jgi:hypothetical protein